MYNNRNNNFQNPSEFKNDIKCTLVESKTPVFKTIKAKDGKMLDLFEFWVIDDETNEEVQCVAWNQLASEIKADYNIDEYKKIIISCWKKINPVTNKTSYSIKKYSFTN